MADEVKLAGNDGIVLTGYSTNTWAYFQRFGAVASGKVTQFRLKIKATTNLKVAIYSDIDGVPGTCLAQTSSIFASIPNDWNSLDFDGPSVIQGATYWLAWTGTSGEVVHRHSLGGVEKFLSAPNYSSFVYPNNPAPLNSDVRNYAVAVWGTIPSGGAGRRIGSKSRLIGGPSPLIGGPSPLIG